MKLFRRTLSLILTLFVLLGVMLPVASANAPSVSLTVLFTHDTHDHFYPDSEGRGGYTRLATLLEQQRQTGSLAADGSRYRYPTVTLDAGDFSMGTLFQTIYTTDAPELQALGAMGYDVTTLGNHEFDYRGEGLAQMLESAKASGAPLPEIVCANYLVDYNGEDTETKLAMSDALEAYPVNTSYTILERPEAVGLDGKSPLRVAVFGLMGKESHSYAPMSGMALGDPVATARRVLAEIEADGGADFIICLSHGGTDDGESGEDYELAKVVSGIDLIISGHSHTVLQEPALVNSTYIVSCGDYSTYLGRITLSKKVSAGKELTGWDYQLIPVDEQIPEDPAMVAMAEEFKAKVDEEYLSQFNLSYDQVLTRATEEFSLEETGNLIGDAYIDLVKEIEGKDYVPVDFAVAPYGVIRDYIRKGNVTTGQAFDILSLGSGADGSPGYPLISVYLTGKDLKNAFEVDASVSQIMQPAILYGSGMYWTWNPRRMFLDRVTDGVQMLEDGTTEEIDDDRLYRVVADLYTGQMLGTVEGKSFGILAVTPRDEAGEPVTDMESRIILDKKGREVKSWYALASYLEEQSAVTPAAPRKMAEPSWNPISLVGNPGLPTLAVMAAVLLLVLIILLIVKLVCGYRRRRDGYRRYRGR